MLLRGYYNPAAKCVLRLGVLFNDNTGGQRDKGVGSGWRCFCMVWWSPVLGGSQETW